MKLFGILERIIGSQNESEPVCLILDNLNYLVNSVSPENCFKVLDLIHYCDVLVKSRKNPGCVVCLAHSDSEDDSTFLLALKYRADLVMEIRSFSSGYLKDVDGELTFSRKETNRHKSRPLTILHLKVLGNAVRFHHVNKC
eukprot:TRINITY_DN12173_c0_g1_i1.p1 TRINITY_DN12173_c0_g1~~TRINITY_DN12173_c0_g1_i1.p1  ORF type:complete len:141 (-),score=11.34 TRINITY_DN12173_c0_g1_i1:27-449(-)